MDGVVSGRADELIDFEARAPGWRKAHPSTEHLLPFHFALGAAGAAARRPGGGAPLFRGWAMGNLSMAAFEWKIDSDAGGGDALRAQGLA